MEHAEIRDVIVCWVEQAIMENVGDDGEWAVIEDIHEQELMSLITAAYVGQMVKALADGEIKNGTWSTFV